MAVRTCSNIASVDPTKIFFPLLLSNNTRIYFIPSSQLPEELRIPFLQTQSKENEMPIVERKKRIEAWQMKYGRITVDEFINIKTLKLTNQTTKEFQKVFPGKKLLDEVKAQLNSGKKVVTFGEVKSYYDPFFSDFEAQIGELFNSYPQVMPHECFRMFWDTISQMALQNQNFTPEEKAILSRELVKYWEEVWYNVSLFCDLLFENPLAKAAVERGEELKRVFNSLGTYLSDVLPANSEDFLEEMQKILEPLIRLCSLEFKIGPGYFALYLSLSTAKSLGQILKDQIQAVPSRELTSNKFRNWLDLRVELLKITREIASFHPHPTVQNVFSQIDGLASLFANRQWLLAHEAVSRLFNTLQVFVSTRAVDKMIENNHIGLVTSFDEAMQAATLSPITLTKAPSQEGFKLCRVLHYLRSLNADFEYMLINGHLFELVSKEALELMQTGWPNVCNAFETSGTIGIPVSDWGKSLCKYEYPELSKSLKEVNDSWKRLKGVKASFEESNLQQKIEVLFKNIKEEQYESVSKTYNQISLDLEQLVLSWEQELRTFNQAICNCTQMAYLALVDSSLPRIELKVLKGCFIEFNTRFGQLIKPVNQFLNGFRQLICLDETAKITSNHLLLNDNESLELAQFPTKKTYFQTLASLQETEATAISIEMDFLELDELSSSAKSKKTIKEYLSILKKHQVPYSTAFGKGDHLKLFVGGKPVVMPLHTSWRPGTASSIENQFLEQLRDALIKKHIK